jgi:putative transposase
MPRRRRITPAGFVYHVMNRAAGRLILFDCDLDYIGFEHLLSQAQRRFNMKIIAYCLMPNHWHFLLWPETDNGIRVFVHWLCTEHAKRWRRAHDETGRGAVYQGRYRAIPIQGESHLITAWRYVERNPLRAKLINTAELWRWSSLSISRCQRDVPKLADARINLPENWIELVNQPQNVDEVRKLREALVTGTPFGDEDWRRATSTRIRWRCQGRPKTKKGPGSFFAQSQ